MFKLPTREVVPDWYIPALHILSRDISNKNGILKVGIIGHSSDSSEDMAKLIVLNAIRKANQRSNTIQLILNNSWNMSKAISKYISKYDSSPVIDWVKSSPEYIEMLHSNSKYMLEREIVRRSDVVYVVIPYNVQNSEEKICAHRMYIQGACLANCFGFNDSKFMVPLYVKGKFTDVTKQMQYYKDIMEVKFPKLHRKILKASKTSNNYTTPMKSTPIVPQAPTKRPPNSTVTSSSDRVGFSGISFDNFPDEGLFRKIEFKELPSEDLNASNEDGKFKDLNNFLEPVSHDTIVETPEETLLREVNGDLVSSIVAESSLNDMIDEESSLNAMTPEEIDDIFNDFA